jgi:tryptophan synthase beta chain
MNGYFGQFGGRFVPELLMPPLVELEHSLAEFLNQSDFKEELSELLTNYAGRATPLTFCPAFSAELGVKVFLKREYLLHTGAHKVNNTLGQALLAKKMGKKNLIAETGAGQHGVATAAAAARLGLSAKIFMGAVDVERQRANVDRMHLLGAEVVAVSNGTQTLKDAINETLRYWIAHQKDTLYCFGTAAGPHPFPELVAHFQSVISFEARGQILKRTGALPDYVVAAVGGGSNAIGMFRHFLDDREVRLIGVEAAGAGDPGCYNSAPINLGRPGVLHGQLSMLLQDEAGQVLPSHSISAGLDYPGVGPEHAHLAAIGRVRYEMADDAEALNACRLLSRAEGIIPALESSHALAWAIKRAPEIQGRTVLICLSGRGDKDLDIIKNALTERGLEL